MIMLMLNNGVDVNCKSNNGSTGTHSIISLIHLFIYSFAPNHQLLQGFYMPLDLVILKS